MDALKAHDSTTTPGMTPLQRWLLLRQSTQVKIFRWRLANKKIPGEELEGAVRSTKVRTGRGQCCSVNATMLAKFACGMSMGGLLGIL